MAVGRARGADGLTGGFLAGGPGGESRAFFLPSLLHERGQALDCRLKIGGAANLGEVLCQS